MVSRTTRIANELCFVDDRERGTLIRMPLDALHRPFPNLVTIEFSSFREILNEDIEKILKCNPQIRDIKLGACRHLSAGIFKIIAEYAPQVENLSVHLFSTLFPDQHDSARYFGQLSNLKSLMLAIYPMSPFNTWYIITAIRKINEAKISLKKLNLKFAECALPGHADDLADEIMKLKKLEVLVLTRLPGLEEYHVGEICKLRTELLELHVALDFLATPEWR